MEITQPYAEMMVGKESIPMPLADQIDELFGRAEPRLRRIAWSQQITSDAAEDIVQETLLEAWRGLAHLRDEARFDAWLDGICRNVCYRHRRKQGIMRARETRLICGDDEAGEESGDMFANLGNPDVFDPTEELTRRDWALLLDRALGHLSHESRIMVEQHYLAEIPQRELAARMGMTLSALAARLHRARGQIMHTLSHELRAEALALGLAVHPDDAVGWRETRIWCIFCGQQRMEGMFEPMPDGRINMRLRCPRCKPIELHSAGIVDLSNARSFLPAAKKLVSESARFVSATMAAGGACQCWICQRETQLNISQDDGSVAQTWLHSSCGCIRMLASPVTVYGSLPQVWDFMFGADRITVEPEVATTYAGQNAMRFCLRSPGDGRRLYVFADPMTLRPLTVVAE